MISEVQKWVFGLFPRFYSWKAKTFKAAITSSHFSWNFLKEIQTKINQKETKFIKLLPDFFHSTLKKLKNEYLTIKQYLTVQRIQKYWKTVLNAYGPINQKRLSLELKLYN